MQKPLTVYNTLTRRKEIFVPLQPSQVSMYVCGPTVYGHAHLGHARSAVNFDVVRRYLRHLNYRVCCVRNITDVGHLMGSNQEGADKITSQARAESLQPMEVVQRYTQSYHDDLRRLNVLPPDIEPSASGHIVEQIEWVERLRRSGMAYEVGGSVYFDVMAYHRRTPYGKLSARVPEALRAGTRTLQKQAEKRNLLDFALWKNATPQHLMQWTSPWGKGFPGWHTECATLATKYLGIPFDIHAGGMDLVFPHHECELAQVCALGHDQMARYWMHNNMVTVEGQKMSKSLANFVPLYQIFDGSHSKMDQAYSPMVLRFFLLQSHYRSPISFSLSGLQAAQKGCVKLLNGLRLVRALRRERSVEKEDCDHSEALSQIRCGAEACHEAMRDDFHTARTIATLFDLLKMAHKIAVGQGCFANTGVEALATLEQTYTTFVESILGIREEKTAPTDHMLDVLLALYDEAKQAKRYAQVTYIRKALEEIGMAVQDTQKGTTWSYTSLGKHAVKR